MHNLGTLIILSLISLPVIALPDILKIENPRDRALYVHSDKLKKDIEIPPKGYREIAIVADGDWRFQYATGAARVVSWNLDEKVSDVLARCRLKLGKLWDDTHIHTCKLVLEPVREGRRWTSYHLDINQIVDSHIRIDAIAEKLKNYQAEEGLIFSEGELSLEKALLEKVSLPAPVENYVVEFLMEVAEVTGLKAAADK